MRSTIWRSLFALGTVAVRLCHAEPTANFTLLQRANPTVANGGFEQGPLRPAWTPTTTGKAGVIIVKQPGKPKNHVARVNIPCNPCRCDDDECCSAELTGTMLNMIPNAAYSITWNFMYSQDVSEVFWLGDAYHCDTDCRVSSFADVHYPTAGKAKKWYTYSASFTAPENANDGRVSLDVFPGGCNTGYTYLDNFRVYGPF